MSSTAALICLAIALFGLVVCSIILVKSWRVAREIDKIIAEMDEELRRSGR